MVRQDRLNCKSWSSIISASVTQNNLDLKHLAVTSIQEWRVRRRTFEKAFVADKALLHNSLRPPVWFPTDFFYKEIGLRLSGVPTT